MQLSSVGGTTGAGFIGGLTGAVIWMVVSTTGAWIAYLTASHPNGIITPGVASTVFLVAVLVADIVLLVFLSRKPIRTRKDALVRAFGVSAAWVALGGLSICSLLALSMLKTGG